MLSILKNKAVALVAVTAAGLFVGTGTASAQSFRQVHRLARQLEDQAREVHREVHAHFRAAPQFGHLERDVREMQRLAKHVHDVADRRGSLQHLRDDVRELDRLFHHVEDLVSAMGRIGSLDRRAFFHLRGDLRRMERTLHDLRDELRPDFGRRFAPRIP